MVRSQHAAGLVLIGLSAFSAWFFLQPASDAPESPVAEQPSVVQEQVQVSTVAASLATSQPEQVIIQEIVKHGVPLVLPVPRTLDFCGEEVPLDDPDIKERLERELYIMAHRYHQVVFYMKRGHRVLSIIDKEIQKKGLPADLRYIAVAESDLMPAIKSPKGARGVWQFMPATAQRYDLRVDKHVDERMHVSKATRAALDYLSDNRNDLGSWTMAAAAYNMGEARARRTQKEQRVNNFYRLYMNEETSRYIFRILAAKIILESPKDFGYDIPADEIYREEPVKKVRASSGINDLVSWSLQMGVTYYDVKRLNPWIIGDRLPSGSFEIVLPERIGSGLTMSSQ